MTNSEPRPPSTYLHFDGIDDYVEIPDSGVFSVATTGELTVSAWIRPATLQFPSIEGTGYVHWLGKGEPDQHEWTFRMYSAGNAENRGNRISFYVFNLTGQHGVGSHFQDVIVAGTWIHVVGVVDSNRTYIYRDGDLRDSDIYQGTIVPQHGVAPVRIGTRDFNSYFQGEISQVRIWNRALLSTEVADLSHGITVPQTGLVAEYPLIYTVRATAYDTIDLQDGQIYGATGTYEP